MNILIFVIVLAVLILVHELGHFIVAKKSGVKAEEFGIGFPPRILTLFRWRGTDFTLNLLPFGGFVKIFGENPSEEEISPEERKQNFSYQPKSIQALILVAGVAFNLIFAWILISVGFMYGLPSAQEPDSPYTVVNERLTVLGVLDESPALEAGIKTGDKIIGIESGQSSLNELNPESVSNFISGEDVLTVEVERGEEVLSFEITPEEGIIEEGRAIGISMGMIGTLKLPPHLAIWEGAKNTASLTGAVAVGLVQFIGQTVTGQADFSQIAGPVGIVGLVGDASALGFIFLIQFTAFISINLAVLNLFPFPALDGGRLLFVLIEAVKGSAINPKVANTLNAAGFIFLLILILLVTVNDVIRLF